MKKLLAFLMVGSFLAMGSPLGAADVEFVSSGEGDKSVGHDAPNVDDPYKGKEVKQRDLDGHPLTQQGYGKECTDDKCVRAEKRQTSEGTDWRDDVKSGLKHGGYGTTEKGMDSGGTEQAPAEGSTEAK